MKSVPLVFLKPRDIIRSFFVAGIEGHFERSLTAFFQTVHDWSPAQQGRALCSATPVCVQRTGRPAQSTLNSGGALLHPGYFLTNSRPSWPLAHLDRLGKCALPPIRSSGTMSRFTTAEELRLFSATYYLCVCFSPRFRLVDDRSRAETRITRSSLIATSGNPRFAPFFARFSR